MNYWISLLYKSYSSFIFAISFSIYSMLFRFFTDIDDTLFLRIFDDASLFVGDFYELVIRDDIKLVMLAIYVPFLSLFVWASTDLNISFSSLISCFIWLRI